MDEASSCLAFKTQFIPNLASAYPFLLRLISGAQGTLTNHHICIFIGFDGEKGGNTRG
jgi:hypothetical protein